MKAVECDADKILKQRGLDENGRVQQFIDSECLRLCNTKFVPRVEGTLIKSGIVSSGVKGGQIEWNTPYARRLYYHPEYEFNQNYNAEAGGYWFERMKQQYCEKIRKGAQKIANGEM